MDKVMIFFIRLLVCPVVMLIVYGIICLNIFLLLDSFFPQLSFWVLIASFLLLFIVMLMIWWFLYQLTFLILIISRLANQPIKNGLFTHCLRSKIQLKMKDKLKNNKVYYKYNNYGSCIQNLNRDG